MVWHFRRPGGGKGNARCLPRLPRQVMRGPARLDSEPRFKLGAQIIRNCRISLHAHMRGLLRGKGGDDALHRFRVIAGLAVSIQGKVGRAAQPIQQPAGMAAFMRSSSTSASVTLP